MDMVSTMDVIINVMTLVEKERSLSSSQKSNYTLQVLEQVTKSSAFPINVQSSMAALIQMKPVLLGMIKSIVDASKGRLKINKWSMSKLVPKVSCVSRTT